MRCYSSFKYSITLLNDDDDVQVDDRVSTEWGGVEEPEKDVMSLSVRL